MIKNLIFDFGQVLVRFDPDTIMSPYLPDSADRETVGKVLFDRLWWDQLDAGTLTEEEALAEIAPKLPHRLREPAAQIFRNWHRHLPPVDGMWELVGRMKREFGLSVYLLSNISREFATHAGEFPVLRQMDGCVFSALAGFVKPSKEIFAYTCEKFGLNPAETLFIDDAPRNIAGAEAFGIRAYRFDGNAQRLETYLLGQITVRNT